MKILIIGSFPPPIHGMSLANEILYQGLLKEGLDIDVINTNTLFQFGNLKDQGKLRLYKVYKTFLQLIKGYFSINFKKIDIIYMTPGQSYFGFKKYTHFMKWAIRKNIPFYFHIHGGNWRKMYNSLDYKKQRDILDIIRKSAGVIVLGNSLKKMFDDIMPKNKIFVCENGVQSDYIASREDINKKIEKYKNDTVIRILYLSNLMESKGILDLLEASKLMKEKNIDFHLDIAGNVEPVIKNEIYKYFDMLKNEITYHGVVAGKKKKELLLNNYIFVLPTKHPYSEGQPLSILEAYINGCAVVTTNHGGIIDIFEDKKNGYYCSKSDPADIVNKVRLAYRNFVCISIKNYNLSISKFSAKNFVRRVKNIIFSF